MTLQLYNTLTKAKETFVPLDSDNVRMYVCGPTVYDYAHIGNARPVIVFDVLFRLLRHIYGAEHVTYVRNITDVDDKINARAAEDYPGLPLNEAIAKVTTATTLQFHKDISALGVLRPDVEPKCTGHIPEMIAMIETLIAKGHAYEAEGHVLLDVASVPDYGRLSRRSLDEMIAGARVEVAPYKKNPADSVLWKPSDDTQPGWPSPWGRGRPGWHIECSAMAEKHLGDTFDIHGGGIDLQFPHHENELAQSCAAHGTDIMAQLWMHNGFLQVEGQKMSKSLGNFLTIHDLLDKWPGDVLRFNMLRTHYRQPIDWTEQGLHESETILKRFGERCRGIAKGKVSDEVIGALEDDLNTPGAFTVLHKLDDPSELWASLVFLGFELSVGSKLGLVSELSRLPEQLLAAADGDEVKAADMVRDAITARAAARADKNWTEADRIRDDLAALGIQLKDAKNAESGEIETTWEVKR